MAYSEGFSPHPKISYAGAAPTGTASEAEYFELGLAEERDPEDVRAALNTALPAGMQLNAIAVAGSGSLADRINASHWQLRLTGMTAGEAETAVSAFLAAESVLVERVMKDGARTLDARSPVVSLTLSQESTENCVILDVVVRHVIPAVRPDDVLAALREIADLVPPSPPVATRLAQGLLADDGRLADPLDIDAVTSATDQV
jgi:radical SAM-linked protein